MDLQAALLIVGLLVIALVVAVSLYDRARRLRPRRLPSEDGAGGVPRRQAPHIEVPSVTVALDINPVPAAAGHKALRADMAVEPGEPAQADPVADEPELLEDAAQVPLHLGQAPARPDEKPPAPAAPDEKLDFILSLAGEGPVARDAALGIFKQHEYRLDKPRRLYGRHYQGALWSDLARDPQDTRYGDLALAIQLYDSRGPIDESELNTFSQVGLKLADALARPTKFSLTFEEALKRAQELGVFSEAYDVIAGINVLARGEPFRGRAIEQAAERAGLKFGARNIFHMKSDLTPGCRHLFSMANLFQPGDFNPRAWDSLETRGLALFMSVPCAHHPASVFVKMVTAAKVVAEALGGELRDEDGKPLTDKGLAIIRRQVEEIDRRMTEHGIVPGSRTALRLFRESLIA
jgi:cell division protein ZipA